LQPPFPPSSIGDISFTRTRFFDPFPGKQCNFDAFLLIRAPVFRCKQWLGIKARERIISDL